MTCYQLTDASNNTWITSTTNIKEYINAIKIYATAEYRIVRVEKLESIDVTDQYIL